MHDLPAFPPWRVLPALTGSLLVLAVGSGAAAAAGQEAQARSKVRYRLTVDFRAKDTYTQTGTTEGEGNQITTYRAKSARPCSVRRSSSGRSRSPPRFSFVTRLSGEFTWEGGGFGGLGGTGCALRL